MDVLLDILGLLLDGASLAATLGESNSGWYSFFGLLSIIATLIAIVVGIVAFAMS